MNCKKIKKRKKKGELNIGTIVNILIWLVIFLIIAGSVFYILKKLGYI